VAYVGIFIRRGNFRQFGGIGEDKIILKLIRSGINWEYITVVYDSTCIRRGIS
jgi:hypothetical protein